MKCRDCERKEELEKAEKCEGCGTPIDARPMTSDEILMEAMR